MPIRGGKKKSRGKNKNKDDERKKDVILKTEGQEYARVIKREGGPILSLKLFSGKQVKGTIRGSMRRRCWISNDDIVLVGLRDFQEDKVDVIYKYDDSEARELIAKGCLTSSFVNSTSGSINLEELSEDQDKIRLQRLQKKLESYSLNPVEYKNKIHRIKKQIEELRRNLKEETITEEAFKMI